MSITATPIKGYTPLSDAQRALGNAFKELEEALLRVTDAARNTDLDQRFLSIAVTHFQEGFTALNRANFKPERIAGPIDSGAAASTAVALLESRKEKLVSWHSGGIVGANLKRAVISDLDASAINVKLNINRDDPVKIDPAKVRARGFDLGKALAEMPTNLVTDLDKPEASE